MRKYLLIIFIFLSACSKETTNSKNIDAIPESKNIKVEETKVQLDRQVKLLSIIDEPPELLIKMINENSGILRLGNDKSESQYSSRDKYFEEEKFLLDTFKNILKDYISYDAPGNKINKEFEGFIFGGARAPGMGCGGGMYINYLINIKTGRLILLVDDKNTIIGLTPSEISSNKMPNEFEKFITSNNLFCTQILKEQLPSLISESKISNLYLQQDANK